MHAMFVHGMGRSPLSGWPMLRRLERAGVGTSTFGYWVSLERFDDIRKRLAAALAQVAATGEYVLIGHSLGGVLLRSALADAPADLRRPRRLFLLGSPVADARLARRLGANPIFRTLTRDCGALLGSAPRMAALGPCTVPTTAIAGTRGVPFTRGLFNGEPNDGIVAVSEVCAPWIEEHRRVGVVHTLLPASADVAAIILDRLGVQR